MKCSVWLFLSVWRRCPTGYLAQSFDKYCGVNCMRRDWPTAVVSSACALKGQTPFVLNATPQKSFGLREAIIHTRLIANSEHPYVKLVNRAVACADCRTKRIRNWGRRFRKEAGSALLRPLVGRLRLKRKQKCPR